MRTVLSDDLDRFADTLAGRHFGTVEIMDAEAHLDTDSRGDPMVVLSLTLNDPKGDTWPLDEILDLRHSIRDEMRLHPSVADLHPYFSLSPEHPEPLADEDDDLPW